MVIYFCSAVFDGYNAFELMEDWNFKWGDGSKDIYWQGDGWGGKS